MPFDVTVAGTASGAEVGQYDGDRDLYENIENGKVFGEEQNYVDDDGWGSSEFEDYDDMSGDQLSVGAKSQGSVENIPPAVTDSRKGNHKHSGAIKRLWLNRLSWRKSGSSDSQSLVSYCLNCNYFLYFFYARYFAGGC